MGLYRGVVPTIMKQGTNQAVRVPIQFVTVKVLRLLRIPSSRIALFRLRSGRS